MSEANDPKPPLDYASHGLRGRQHWWPLLVALLILIILAMSVLYPSFNRVRADPDWLVCQSRLRQIGQAILLYTNDYQGQYPDSFGTLLLNEDITSDVFVCPETNDVAATGATTQAAAANLTTGGHLSYIYLGKGMNSATVPANAIVAYEPLSNHANTGMNVLFGDGHVDFIKPSLAGTILFEVAAKKFPVTMPAQ